MKIIYDCLNLPLWEDVGATIQRYRKRFSLKTSKQLCRERSERLELAIDGSWRTAGELADMVDIPRHAAAKLLSNMVHAGTVEAKEHCWIDQRFRARSVYLYAKPDRQDFIAIYNSMFGLKLPEHTGNIRTHRLSDRSR